MSTPTRPEVTIELTFITPDLASAMLRHNTRNRKMRARGLDRMVRSMTNGLWMFTHQGIAFDWNDDLLDGQHRLQAIVKSDRGQWMIVVHDLNPDIMPVIDGVQKRGAGDALRWAGFTNANDLAAMAKIVISFDGGVMKTSTSARLLDIPAEEILEWAEMNGESATDAVTLARRIYDAKYPTPSLAALASAAYIITRISPQGAAQFFEDMANLTMRGKGDPLFTLYGRLANVGTRSGKRERLGGASLLHLYFRTWNAYCQGEPLTALKVGSVSDGRGGSVPISMAAPVIHSLDVEEASR